eukprot:c2925_g1_i1.p1 GENE.c2925_g1_i1~~c2925_g1_i1.p1  ORF type:complete len:146 (+),score=38.86 c2925_g1_i1:319-756(+)
MLEMVVQFGYIVLFAGAFPLAASLAIISNLLELKSDVYKLCFLCRKPPSCRASSLGGWNHVMKAIAVVAVMTNCYIFGFTSDQLSSIFPMLVWKAGQARYVLLAIFGIEHAMFGLQFLVDLFVANEPAHVRLFRERDLHFSRFSN